MPPLALCSTSACDQQIHLGQSPVMQAVESLIDRLSPRDCPVLVLGETGTGKELVAHLVHERGPRYLRPLVIVDCASITPTLIESELFGHTKGAFTGAFETKYGLFEKANGGTLFLDEIAELPVGLQAKLLRTMQEREIRRVGSNVCIPINFRVIAATNRDLEVAVKCGEFRRDLYFRLNVVEIKLPPLRERKTDIPFLVAKFLERHGDGFKWTISDGAMRRLLAHDWPGNVRELENVIRRAVTLSPRHAVQAADFTLDLGKDFILHDPVEPLSGNDEIVPLNELKRRAILRALEATGGDRRVAARILGIGTTTLYRKLRQGRLADAAPR